MGKLKTYKKLNRSGWLITVFIFYILLKFTVNSEPVFAVVNGQLNFGFLNFNERPLFEKPDYTFNINPLFLISPYQTDLSHAHPLPPFSRNQNSGLLHVMGTDHLGRDVFAGFVSGLEVALIISLCVGLFTGMITMLLGALGAYYGRFPKKTTQLRLILLICLVILILINLSWFLMNLVEPSVFSALMAFLILLTFVLLKLPIKNDKKTISLPLSMVNRSILEFLQPVPDIIFLMLFAMIFDQMNLTGLIVILILLRIPFGSYYLQGLANQFVNQQHIDQAKSLGLSSIRIIRKHLIPLMLPGTAVFMVLAASRAVLSESALAFLGIGPTGSYITWGTMIRLGLNDLTMWWVSFFPIMGLLALSLLFQKMGRKLEG